MTKLLLSLFILFSAVTLNAQDTDNIKRQINIIKKSDAYIWEEATAPTQDESLSIAEELLYESVNAWAATQRKLYKSHNIVINNIKGQTETLALKRGNMFRSFCYVKKADIIGTENTTVMTVSSKSEVTNVMPQSQTYPDCIMNLANVSDAEKMLAMLKEMKQCGQVEEYKKYADITDRDAYYFIIYNREKQVVAVLSKGPERKNVKTGAPSNISTDYKGCGAIGIKTKN